MLYINARYDIYTISTCSMEFLKECPLLSKKIKKTCLYSFLIKFHLLRSRQIYSTSPHEEL